MTAHHLPRHDTAARPSSVSPVNRRIISVSMMPGQMALMRMFEAA
ncbi:MAG TPA: hypothetical protein VIY10_07355 [Solirubrobacteraceae bacterium]